MDLVPLKQWDLLLLFNAKSLKTKKQTKIQTLVTVKKTLRMWTQRPRKSNVLLILICVMYGTLIYNV